MVPASLQLTWVGTTTHLCKGIVNRKYGWYKIVQVGGVNPDRGWGSKEMVFECVLANNTRA